MTLAWAITAVLGTAIGYAIVFTNNFAQLAHLFSAVVEQCRDKSTDVGCVAAASQYHTALAAKVP